MYPVFDLLTLPPAIPFADRYKVYAYHDRRFPRWIRPSAGAGMGRDTITARPIFFFPGNAGSYAQVRSLASALLEQQQQQQQRSRRPPTNPRGEWHIYTFDYNAEYSVFFGLINQVAFATHAVTYLLSQYNAGQHPAAPPRPVIFWGHSMGGLVARHMAKDEKVNVSATIFTFGTPHSAPPFSPVPPETVALYKALTTQPLATQQSRTVVVSIAGGANDILGKRGGGRGRERRSQGEFKEEKVGSFIKQAK